MKRVLIILAIMFAAVIIVVVGMLLRGNTGTTPNPTDSLPVQGGLPLTGTDSTNGNTGATDTNNNDQAVNPGGLPVAGLSAVSLAKVLDYTISAQMGLLIMDAGGAIISASSSESIIARAEFQDILGGWFSPDGKWLLVKSGADSAARWSLFDVTKKTWKDIIANTYEMAWSPTGNQLAYFARRATGSTLNTYNPATGATKAVMQFNASDLTLRWQNASRVFVMDRPSSLVSGNVWGVSLTNFSVAPFAVSISGADIRWGGDKSGGMLFKAGPTGGTLSLMDASGNTNQVANFLTLPSKCVFGETNRSTSTPSMAGYIFCAIPQDASLMRRYQLPDDYIKKVFGTADSLYAVDIASGVFSPLLPTTQSFSFDAENLKIYADSIYFINRNDQKLYKASLEKVVKLETATN